MEMERKVEVAYITKYALSTGIMEIHGAAETELGLLRFRNLYGHLQLFSKKDWTEDLEQAKRIASYMVERKLASTKKLLKKLETYEAPVTQLKTLPP